MTNNNDAVAHLKASIAAQEQTVEGNRAVLRYKRNAPRGAARGHAGVRGRAGQHPRPCGARLCS